MFRELAQIFGSKAKVFACEPPELADYLESYWDRTHDTSNQFNAGRLDLLSLSPRIPVFQPTMAGYHLIYAFLIESTGIYEIFTRVLAEVLNGERLGILSEEAQLWVRNTEDLFFKPPPFGSIYGVESRLRPDVRATRRNVYYRMFGAELAHVQDPHVSFVQPQATNREFVSTLGALLHEVWLGIVNQTNTSGANPTDNFAITQHVEHLKEMLSARRQFNTLSREEFFAIATMSWFHLTVDFDSAIVSELGAEGTSAERRLSRVGERVNLRPHDHADSYFRLADPLAIFLTQIESVPQRAITAYASALYAPGPLRRNVEAIITHWSTVTDRNLKIRPSQDVQRVSTYAGEGLKALPAR
jgi:hypothetical protein